MHGLGLVVFRRAEVAADGSQDPYENQGPGQPGAAGAQHSAEPYADVGIGRVKWACP